MSPDSSNQWDPTELSKSDALVLLSHFRRRCILRALLDADEGGLSRSDLVATVTDEEEERPPSTDETRVRRDVESTLHHHHLPKLAELGVVECERATGRITLGSSAPDVIPLLRFVGDGR